MQPARQGFEVKSSGASSAAGLILLDGAQKPIYFNSEAVRVLTFPRSTERVKNLRKLLSAEIRAILLHATGPGCLARPVEFLSGRRRYLCRAFSLAHNTQNPSRSITGLLIERTCPKSADVAKLAEQFHLTPREQETVSLLKDGLTSKEIASRLEVSPNTVKTFFRFIMTKMAVSTRSGIIGKLVQS